MTERYPREITLKITEDDIRRGIRERCEECPAALAAIRLFPGHGCSAGQIGVVLMSPGGEVTMAIYETSEALQAFMDDFDAGYPVSPAEYGLRRIR